MKLSIEFIATLVRYEMNVWSKYHKTISCSEKQYIQYVKIMYKIQKNNFEFDDSFHQSMTELNNDIMDKISASDSESLDLCKKIQECLTQIPYVPVRPLHVERVRMDAPLILDRPLRAEKPFRLETPESVINDLEKRGHTYIETNGGGSINDLMQHMKNGVEEFEKKTGKPMTYAEMRAAWG